MAVAGRLRVRLAAAAGLRLGPTVARRSGRSYRGFDGPRRLPRLPGPPYHFMSRISSGRRASWASTKAGAEIEAEYDVPPDAWYFAENGCP